MNMDDEFKFESKSGCWYPDAKSYLFTGVLKGCGCGSSYEIAEDVWEILEAIAGHKENRFELINSDKYHEFIAHMLDGAGLLEHGSSIGGSWLSAKGLEICEEVGIPHPAITTNE